MNERSDLRPDQEMEGRVSSWLTDTDLAAEEADAGLDRLLQEFPVTPQARRRFLGRWLDRSEGAGRRTTDRDHPPDMNRRTRLMFSTTGAIAALGILALSVSVIDTSPAPPNAGSGTTHVVAADGSGDFSTIADAVAAATVGDTVSIRPGTYTEAVVIDKDITLTGDGPREDIVITAPEDGPTYSLPNGPVEPYAIALLESYAMVSGITVTGPNSSIVVDGGAPTLRSLRLIEVREPYAGGSHADRNAIAIGGGSRMTLADSIIDASGATGVFESDPLIEGNTFSGGAHIWGWFGDDAAIRSNEIRGALTNAIAILESGPMTIEGNSIDGAEQAGVTLMMPGAAAPRIMGNRISNTSTGIAARSLDAPLVSGNTLTDNDIGIALSNADGRVIGNEISRGFAGIMVSGGSTDGSAPELSANRIDPALRGLILDDTTEASSRATTSVAVSRASRSPTALAPRSATPRSSVPAEPCRTSRPLRTATRRGGQHRCGRGC